MPVEFEGYLIIWCARHALYICGTLTVNYLTMTKLLSIISLVALISCQPQNVDYRPFDKLDLDEKPAVYFILSEGDWGDFEETNNNFVLTDKVALQKIMDNWRLTKTDNRMSCGFGYLVFITSNNKLIEEIHINEPCGYAVTTGGWYNFDDDYYDFIDLSKIQKLTASQADSIQSALVKQGEDNNR